MPTGKRVPSWRQTYLPWCCAILAPLLLLSTDRLLRVRERSHYQAYIFESTRRSMTDQHFKFALYMTDLHESPDWLAKQLAPIGTVSKSNANGIWKMHVTNPATGDVADGTISKHGIDGTIEFHPEISSKTAAWEFFSVTWKILGWTTSALLLLGFAAFFMPGPQRPWALMVALLGAVASQLSPDSSSWFVLSHGAIGGSIGDSVVGSIVPLFTLGVVVVATLIPQRLTNPNQCAKCRYNLTGNVSGTCPECGTPVPPPPPPRIPDIDSLAHNFDLIE